MGTSRKIREWVSIEAMRDGAGKENLVVILLDVILVGEHKFGDECTGLQRAIRVEVRNIAHDEAIRVECDRVAFLDEAPEVVVMIDQSLKH